MPKTAGSLPVLRTSNTTLPGAMFAVAATHLPLSSMTRTCGGATWDGVTPAPLVTGKKKMSVAIEILAHKPAFGGINLKIGGRTWLDAGERPHQPFGSLAPWHAIRHDAARRQFIMEQVIPGRKRIRLMEANAAHGGRNRKRHTNVIVESGFVIALTEMAMEMRVQFAQVSEALDNVGAHRTNQQPVHVEQPGHAGMEEKIDPFSFGNRLLDGELDRIDAVECLVRTRAQQ